VSDASLSPEAIEAGDPSGLHRDVLDQHLQVGDALWRFESAGVPESDAPGGLVVCGMGGSAIGADLAAGVLGDRARRPLRTVRDYVLPAGVGPDTLVLAASYSGNTEETLACFGAAGEAGAPRVALTTGGKLAEAAREAGVPVIGVPSGMQPRAAVVYMVVGALGCAAACGAAPSLREEIEGAAELLRRLADAAGEDDSHPKRLARALHGRTPVVFGAAASAPVASRWKTQVNENAKRPAFAAVLPEADHNEICGWERPGDLAAVFLAPPGRHPRLARRIEVTAEIIEAAGAPVHHVEGTGETPFERVMALVMLGDLVSIYLALLDGVDPTPVEPIERLKRTLGQP
jgi:glucose/mannose-6-phosphate isomerase